MKNCFAPSYLSDHIPEHSEIIISLRDRNTRAPFSRTERYDNSFFPYFRNNWNNLDDSVKYTRDEILIISQGKLRETFVENVVATL